jgi:hypothetical protein
MTPPSDVSGIDLDGEQDLRVRIRRKSLPNGEKMPKAVLAHEEVVLACKLGKPGVVEVAAGEQR